MTDHNLTKRMVEVITWLSKGKTAGEAAQIIGISKLTVDTYIRIAKDRLGAATACGLVGECFRRGLIQ